ncbi:MAG: transcription-repair coupling factor, partial [Verrucomicrobiales bacterium]|nr:transcription-repair coupling factor [Verrucomicrobiales bacterium]
MPRQLQIVESLLKAPGLQAVQRRLEQGGALSGNGAVSAAHPLVSVMLREKLERPVLLIAEGVKTQENFQQDVETWLKVIGSEEKPFFYPAWEVLPQESRLPHSDVISERLETLAALKLGSQKAPVIVTSATALLQKTFAPEYLEQGTRLFKRGDQMDPLDLIEWLEEQGYEPEAQVSNKGEIALRGGILDVYALTSPWPVRLEFFGNELESLRFFDPASQISREEIQSVVIPPAGEIGILKKLIESNRHAAATLFDYLPESTICVFSDFTLIEQQAQHYLEQIEELDPFFIGWEQVLEKIQEKRLTTLSLSEETVAADVQLDLSNLDLYRPLPGRAPEPQIAEAQRQEFFQQMQRWLRQEYSVHVFCNNDGERQRFEEVWNEYGGSDILEAKSLRPETDLGSLGRGFISLEAIIVVVTYAEVFGRYKVD